MTSETAAQALKANNVSIQLTNALVAEMSCAISCFLLHYRLKVSTKNSIIYCCADVIKLST